MGARHARVPKRVKMTAAELGPQVRRRMWIGPCTLSGTRVVIDPDGPSSTVIDVPPGSAVSVFDLLASAFAR